MHHGHWEDFGGDGSVMQNEDEVIILMKGKSKHSVLIINHDGHTIIATLWWTDGEEDNVEGRTLPQPRHRRL